MKELGLQVQSENNKAFKDFLISEYNNIAEAHFNTVNTISNFFRYFLLIITIPIPIVVFLFQQLEGIKVDAINRSIKSLAGMGSVILFFVSICVVAYIINLRFDAILYARTINGIRKYFYDLSEMDIFDLKKIRVLPVNVSTPWYREWRFFYPVILALSSINGFYLFLSVVLFDLKKLKEYHYVLFGGSVFSSIALSTIIYLYLSNYREKGYLSRPIMGVDIDGVLNKHREHFCDKLDSICSKKISPENITKIPVHECKTLECTVEERDCHDIFNDPSYWNDMPVNNECAKILSKVRHVFNYKIEIFTYRPWPEEKTFSKNRFDEYLMKWHQVEMGWRIKRKAIKKITKDWLKKNNIEYDKLTIENGSEYTPNPKMWTKSRFQSARKQNYAYFVEDELPKARKLAQFCDIVFLLDHPYNQCSDTNETNNIKRVKDWNEIYQILKER